mgnify:CR=1 FL=1
MNNKNILYSIIIASWNAEDTIVDAVLSVTCQLKENYEVIVVDDCSTDSTYQKLRISFPYNPNVKIYKNIKNMGPSASRNLGILRSRGEYIGFLDADDTYAEGIFNLVSQSIAKNEPEVIKFGLKEIYSNFEKSVSSSSFFSDKRKEICLKSIELEGLPLFGYSTNGFYDSSLLKQNQLFFDPKLRFAEDFFFNYNVFKQVEKFEFIDFLGYNYYKKSNNSLSQKKIENYGLLYKKKISLLCDWARRNDCLSECQGILFFLLTKTIYSSTIREIQEGRIFKTYENIMMFFKTKEFEGLTPNLPIKGIRGMAYFPILIKSSILIVLLSLIMAIVVKINPNVLKSLNK